MWNSELIGQSFNQDDASLILSLPLWSFNSTDRLFWHYEKLGGYSVRSGYRLGCSLLQEAGSSGSNSSGLWWKFFWLLKIHVKVKHLLWRACHNWIPTNANLARRGINISYLCPLCFTGIESTMHALWGCPSLKKIRSSCCLLSGMRFTDNLPFLDFLVECKDRLSVTEFEVSCIVFWRVWCCRNESVHQVFSLHYDDIVQWASSFISDYRQANFIGGGCNRVDRVRLDRWIPPSSGLFKINTDAAIDGHNGKVGIGIIIRDAAGEVLASSALPISAGFSAHPNS
ncbi:hypothetical protein Ddye_011818 [Dipteronia dyeriana]|uniref:Reverse transcriptase zinc-binding domain-containing protein n=1 Tax=Dipteronia dyeriana TaxID=168575 RepID=A0AAD9X3B9_9ROSI|nr:hypothetical protein Ddye_011818 [Dipteronia dyeriana]